MKYKSERIEAEYKTLHPKLREMLVHLETYTRARGYPEPVITHALRTRKEQIHIYWKAELKKATSPITDAEAKIAAGNRFTWHFHRCAVDLRDYIYTPAQARDVVNWLRANCPASTWEILYHDVGRGNHLHIGIRDRAFAKLNPVVEE